MTKLPTALTFLILIASCNPTEQAANKKDNLRILNSPADSVSAEPFLFTDSGGIVRLSWIEKSTGTSSLKFSMLNNGVWSKPTLITSGNNWFVNWADYPMLTSDGAGNMLAHFLEKSENDKYTYDVKLTSSADNGKTWSKSKILHDDGKKAEHGFVSMLPYRENYFISWLDGRNTASGNEIGHDGGHHGQMTLRAAIIGKQGEKSAEWELDNRVCDCCQTSAAVTSNGPIVIYRDRSEDEIRDMSIVRLVDGKWTTPKPLFSDNWKIAGCPVNGPRADTKDNNLVVAWFTSPDKKGQVNIIFSKDGGAIFGKPIRVDEGKGIGRVDVILLDETTAMVSWMEGSVLKAAKVRTDGTKEASIIVTTSSESRSSGFPQMTKSGNNIIFAWTDDVLKKISTASLALK